MPLDENFFEDDLQSEYDYFFEKYKPQIFPVSPLTREIVSKFETHNVWTYHTTCTDTYISPGFLEFSESSCCYREYFWYVSDLKWESDDSSEWIVVTHYFPCPNCDPDASGAGPFDETCELCEGLGEYQYNAAENQD